MVGTRTPHLRFQQPAFVHYLLFERRAFRTERAAVDRMIGIAFHVHDLRRNVFRLVADGVNDDAATHRAIRTRATSFSSTIDLQSTRLRVNRTKRKAEH